jgi:hypothetical protein
LIGKKELEDRLGELGIPDSKSLWQMKNFRRIYTCSNSNKKKSEKTIIRIYPKINDAKN